MMYDVTADESVAMQAIVRAAAAAAAAQLLTRLLATFKAWWCNCVCAVC
jgi:hypothetical protein